MITGRFQILIRQWEISDRQQRSRRQQFTRQQDRKFHETCSERLIALTEFSYILVFKNRNIHKYWSMERRIAMCLASSIHYVLLPWLVARAVYETHGFQLMRSQGLYILSNNIIGWHSRGDKESWGITWLVVPKHSRERQVPALGPKLVVRVKNGN